MSCREYSLFCQFGFYKNNEYLPFCVMYFLFFCQFAVVGFTLRKIDGFTLRKFAGTKLLITPKLARSARSTREGLPTGSKTKRRTARTVRSSKDVSMPRVQSMVFLPCMMAKARPIRAKNIASTSNLPMVTYDCQKKNRAGKKG